MMKKRILSPHLTIFKGFDLALSSILLRIFAFILSLIIIYFLAYNLIYTNLVYFHIVQESFFNTNINFSVMLSKLNILIIFYLFNLHNINIVIVFFWIIVCFFFIKKDYIINFFVLLWNKKI